MSRHQIMPPAIYAPPPPTKIEKKKPRIGIGQFSELDETEDTRETDQSAPIVNRLLQQSFPEIEDASRKPQHPPGRLSQGTLSVLLRLQELE